MPYLQFAPNYIVLLKNASFIIGSNAACDLSLSGRDILPRHLILQFRGDGWQIATLALQARAYINDQPLDSLALLEDGDVIRIGDTTFVWREQYARPKQRTPWKGLLLIFLAVMTLLSAVFAWFGVTNTYRLDATTSPSPQAPITSPAPAIINASQPFDFQGFSEAGHPIYLIVPPSADR